MKIVRVHKNCGGEIVNRKCTKCGKTWSRARYYLTGEILDRAVGFDEGEYKRRIRERRDILK